MTEVYETDETADGVVDYRKITTETLSPSGELLSRIEETDRNVDGNAEWRASEQFDKQGNLLLLVGESDLNSDGVVDALVVESYT